MSLLVANSLILGCHVRILHKLVHFSFAERCIVLDIKGVSITSNIFYNLVREHTKVALLKQIQSNEKWDDDTAASISWQSTSLVVKRIDREVVITKACHGILPTMQVLHKMKQSSIKKCPICLHTESQEHMLLCNNVLQKKLRRTLVKNLRIEMKKKRTGHALIDHLCSVATEDVLIGCWDTSDVTDMSRAFEAEGDDDETYFNKAINCWNTAHVTGMKYMFQDTTDFNQPLDDWNVASVNNMQAMFLDATKFNQPLNDWDVASVTSMGGMFSNAYNFNQPIDDWNVTSVTDMEFMFSGYEGMDFNQPIND